MCVIIDANAASLVFGQPPDPEFRPVLDWLTHPAKDGRLVYGGRLTREVFVVERARRLVVELVRAGRAVGFPDRTVDAAENRLKRQRVCESDDEHVIALAIVSGARTLCSRDVPLHRDFRNKGLIDRPRGHVYQNPSHAKHLKHTSSCRAALGRLSPP